MKTRIAISCHQNTLGKKNSWGVDTTMLSRRPFSLVDTEKLMVSLLLKQFLIHEPALKKGLQAGLQDFRSTWLLLSEVIP
ncbi:MAG: hypothetical protein WBB64_01275, partial [Anaerolineales bacterium]